jgi:LacI family transcriptional regulator/LacI family asc operon transcriptional repressor
MEAKNIPNYENLICFYDGNVQEIANVTAFIEKQARSGKQFHGVITSDDALAVAAVKYAQQAGLRIPDDLSIIGYNNSVLTNCCTPELTSIDNKLEIQTHQLVQTLLGVLEGREMPKKSLFSGRLIERGTTNF